MQILRRHNCGGNYVQAPILWRDIVVAPIAISKLFNTITTIGIGIFNSMQNYFDLSNFRDKVAYKTLIATAAIFVYSIPPRFLLSAFHLNWNS